MKITLLTKNERKKNSFQKIVGLSGIEIEISDIWVPEIQASTGQEIAKYSAEYGSNKLGVPVVKLDTSFYINELDGFPGPFVHYVDKHVGAEKFFLMLSDKNRSAKIVSCLAYAEPGQNATVFDYSCEGMIVHDLGTKDGSFIDRLFIPHHPLNPDNLAMGEIRLSNYENFLEIWGGPERKFVQWLTKNNKI